MFFRSPEDQGKALRRRTRPNNPETAALTTTRIWVRGLDLPDEVETADLLTPEDRRDIALDHIARTCKDVGHIVIEKWG